LNVAHQYGATITSDPTIAGTWVDQWTSLFAHAEASRPAEATDIIPYWIFPGPAAIERHVYQLPMGSEAPQFQRLRSSLTLYRLVFGQARQDDLVAHLTSSLTEEQLADVSRAAMIDLGAV
jgi:hypothetical protein